MKTPKRKNPYVALLDDIISFVRKLKYAPKETMFFWTTEQLAETKTWRLSDVYQRVQAAKTLGYEVVVEADEKGMTMKYRKIVEAPYHWRT